MAQGDVHGRRLISDSSIYLRGTRIDSISNDTTNAANRTKTLLSADAIYKLVSGYSGSGGVSSLNGNTGALTMDTNYISNFYLKVRSGLSASGPLTFSNGTFSISQANGSTNGYLSSTDWTTFNNKLSSIDTSNISNFYLKVRSELHATAPLSYNSSTGTFSISQANGSTNGYLSSTDWTTFNSKLSSIDTSNISNFYLKVRSLSSLNFTTTGTSGAATGSYNSSTGVYSINVPNYSNGATTWNGVIGGTSQTTTSQNTQIPNTNPSIQWLYVGTNTSNDTLPDLASNSNRIFYFKNLGTGNLVVQRKGTDTLYDGSKVSSYTLLPGQSTFITSGSSYWNVYNPLSGMDTSYISNFYSKVRSELHATAPLSYNSSTGTFSISQANGSTNGYLSSTDWTTFNNKLSSIDTSNISNFYLKVRSLHSGTAPITYNSSTGAIGITQATTSTNGYLSSTDWNTFNNKLSSIDTSNISNFYLKVRSLHSAGSGIGYNSSTGVITNTGVISLNGNTGSLTMDTGYISNFWSKVRSLISASGLITYTNGSIGVNTGNSRRIPYGNYGNGDLMASDSMRWSNGSIQLPYGSVFANNYYTTNTGSVATPASGTGVFYSKTDKLPYFKNSDGTEISLSGSSGFSSIGTIDGNTKSANGLSSSGTTLYAQTADHTHPGLQTASDKAFVDSLRSHSSYIIPDKTSGYDSLWWKKNDSTGVPKSIKVSAGTFTTVSKAGTDSNLLYSIDVNTQRFTMNIDTVALFTFGAGAGNAGDTAAFSTSSLYGSFYVGPTDTLVVTKMVVVMQGTNDTLSVRVQWNDSLNVAGTKLVNTPSPVNNNYTGNSITTFDNYKIPPGNFVWCDSPTVVSGRKPKYLSVTLIGYKSRRL